LGRENPMKPTHPPIVPKKRVKTDWGKGNTLGLGCFLVSPRKKILSKGDPRGHGKRKTPGWTYFVGPPGEMRPKKGTNEFPPTVRFG